jgi:outer membrane protein assembly factor BamB
MSKRLVLTLFSLAVVRAAIAADQPQWGERYSRNLVSAETNLPDTFDPDTKKNVRWVVDLGSSSYATPVIAGSRVLVGTNNDPPRDPNNQGDRGVLLCLNEASGKLLWQLAVPKRDQFNDWPNVGICSPPTVEKGRVYVVSNRGEVLCLDLAGHANGNDGPFTDEARYMVPSDHAQLEIRSQHADVIWKFDMFEELGVRTHDQMHSSPLVHGEVLYVGTSNGVDGTHRHIPAPEAPSLIALDKNTGRLLARDREPIGADITHSTWSSPSLGKVGGRELIFFGAGNAICYAFEALPSNEQREPAGQPGAPPGVPSASASTIRPAKPEADALVHAQRSPSSEAAAAPPGNQGPDVPALKKVWQYDCDPGSPRGELTVYQGNRRTGPSTITGMPVFQDGRVYVTAGGDLWHGKLECFLHAIDARGTGDITKTGRAWAAPLKRHCMSTPSIHNGLAYIADCGRQVSCIDIQTGKLVWVHKADGDIWSSTLVAEGKVYVGSLRGDFWVLAAGRDYKVLSRVDLGEPIHATPTAANGTLYVGTMRRLFALYDATGGDGN